MCTFITLIAATDDLDRVNAILATLDRRGHVRRAERVDTPGLRPLLAGDERAYVLVRPPCDCGTFLGHALKGSADPDAAAAADLARYRRKGWSEARIARAMADRNRAAARPARHRPHDDAAYWIDLLTRLGEGLGLKRLGLMHDLDGRSRGEERKRATRREGGPTAEAAEGLASMAEGAIHDFAITVQDR